MMKSLTKIVLNGNDLTLVEGEASDYNFYREVLKLRKSAFLKNRFYTYYDDRMITSECDPYSRIYCLYATDSPLGTVTVTPGEKGKMHKEHRFPEELFKISRNEMCSIQKLCVDIDKINRMQLNTKVIYRKIMYILEEQLKTENIKKSIISTAVSLHKFQMTLGYQPVVNSEYKNEVNRMDCLIMVKEL